MEVHGNIPCQGICLNYDLITALVPVPGNDSQHYITSVIVIYDLGSHMIQDFGESLDVNKMVNLKNTEDMQKAVGAFLSTANS